MTEDIFTPNFGTLDVIIFAALRYIGLIPASFYPNAANPIDTICEHNARMFVEEHIGKPIEAITMIREATGLNLRDAKDAWEQAIESYYTKREYNIMAAKRAAEAGEMAIACGYLRKV